MKLTKRQVEALRCIGSGALFGDHSGKSNENRLQVESTTKPLFTNRYEKTKGIYYFFINERTYLELSVNDMIQHDAHGIFKISQKGKDYLRSLDR